MADVTIPAPTVQFLNKDGTVNKDWYRFLQAILRLVNAGL